MANRIQKTRAAEQKGLDLDFLIRAEWGDPDELTKALALGANPNATTHDRKSALHLVAMNPKDRSVDCLRLLIPICDPLAKTRDGDTPLTLAAAHGSAAMVEALLPVSDPLARNNEGASALMRACARRKGETAKLLIPVSDLSATDDLGFNAFFISCHISGMSPFQELLPLSSMDARDAHGLSALHRATADKIPALLLAGADPHARDLTGMPPLMTACVRSDSACARALLSASDPSLLDSTGRSALHLACEAGDESSAMLLLQSLDGSILRGGAPLPSILARQSRRPALAQALMEAESAWALRESLSQSLPAAQSIARKPSL